MNLNSQKAVQACQQSTVFAAERDIRHIVVGEEASDVCQTADQGRVSTYYPPVGSRHMAGAAVVGIHTRRGAVVGMLRNSAAEDCSKVRDKWPSML